MDQNEKFIKKLTPSERKKILAALRLIASHNTETLDVKKLTGHQDVFRVRVGSFRIIFISNRSGTSILTVGYRDDNTYRDF